MPAGCGSASSGSCVSSNPSASIVTWRERGIPTVRSVESSLHFSLSAMRCAGSHTALASDGGGGTAGCTASSSVLERNRDTREKPRSGITIASKVAGPTVNVPACCGKIA